MSSSDRLPSYPLNSDLVTRLKSALEAGDEGTVCHLICAGVRHVDAVIELANDDWMKDPSAQLPPQVLLGNRSERAMFVCVTRGSLWSGRGSWLTRATAVSPAP